MNIPRLLHRLPVIILKGSARGKWWTLYPYSAYWRIGGHEPEIDTGIRMAGDLRGSVIWDLGAHFGYYTLVFSCLVGPEGQVVAFEPDAASFGRLCQHMRMNRAANVVAFQAAASDESREDFIVTDDGAGATTSHLLYRGETLKPDSRTQKVICKRADDLLGEGKIRLPGLIKLDVEGHGGFAIRGASASIAQARPLIVASMHSPEEIEGIREVLQPLGYKVQKLDDCEMREMQWDACQCGCNYLLRCG